MDIKLKDGIISEIGKLINTYNLYPNLWVNAIVKNH